MELSPGRLLALNLAGSAGEILGPFVIGLAFERAWYGALGYCLIALASVLVACTLGAWHVAARARLDDPLLEEYATRPVGAELEVRERLVDED